MENLAHQIVDFIFDFDPFNTGFDSKEDAFKDVSSSLLNENELQSIINYFNDIILEEPKNVKAQRILSALEEL